MGNVEIKIFQEITCKPGRDTVKKQLMNAYCLTGPELQNYNKKIQYSNGNRGSILKLP